MDRLAQSLKEARLRANLSQTELAKRLGVSRGAVGQWETGVSEPTGKNLRAASAVLGVNNEWLSSGTGGPERAAAARTSLADGERVDVSQLPPDQAKVIAAAIAGRNAEVWRITGETMVGAGFLPGDLVVVDLAETPRPQNYVLAESGRIPIFRQFLPPYLFCLSLNTQSPPLLIDNATTVVRGSVASRFSF